MDQASGTHEHHFEPRVEDAALVQGLGRFVEDAPQPNQAFAVFVRSPHAHATIATIDTSAARASAGVVAVLTHADMEAAGVGSCAVHPPLVGPQRRKAHRAVPPAARDGSRDASRPAGCAGCRREARACDGRR